MRFNKRVNRYRQHRYKGVKIYMRALYYANGGSISGKISFFTLLWFLFLIHKSIFIMITSSDQALSDSTTSSQPIVSQSCDTSSSNIISNSSSDVKEQHNGTIHKRSDLLLLQSSSDHQINHKHDHKHSVQENVVEHKPQGTSLKAADNDSRMTQCDDDMPAYYTEGLKNPGWLTVLATFMLNFYTIGIVSSWNVFQVL